MLNNFKKPARLSESHWCISGYSAVCWQGGQIRQWYWVMDAGRRFLSTKNASELHEAIATLASRVLRIGKSNPRVMGSNLTEPVKFSLTRGDSQISFKARGNYPGGYGVSAVLPTSSTQTFINPLLPGPPFDEENRLALDRVKSPGARQKKIAWR